MRPACLTLRLWTWKRRRVLSKTAEDIRFKVATTAFNLALYLNHDGSTPQLVGAEYALRELLDWIDEDDG